MNVPIFDADNPQPGAESCTYWTVGANGAVRSPGGIIAESHLSIYVNGQELATVMCSPLDQEALALGFLHNEGIIQSLDEVGLAQANLTRTVVDVLLHRQEFDPPRRVILTSGCSGGITLELLTEVYPPLESDCVMSTRAIFERMADLHQVARIYQQVGGVHTVGLASEDQLLASAEDVGRHNAVDKTCGKALMAGIAMRDRMLLTSGRISSEMLGKARRMGLPLVASRTSPTSMTVRLAEAWNICVVGYVRKDGLRVYTHPERLGLSALSR